MCCPGLSCHSAWMSGERRWAEEDLGQAGQPCQEPAPRVSQHLPLTQSFKVISVPLLPESPGSLARAPPLLSSSVQGPLCPGLGPDQHRFLAGWSGEGLCK